MIRTICIITLLASSTIPTPAGERGAVGDLYVCNQVKNNVLQFDGNTGEFVGQFVTTGSGGLESPHDLTWGPNGNLLVCSPLQNSIKEYGAQDGAFVRDFVVAGDSLLKWPRSMTFGGPDGNLFTLGLLEADNRTAVFEYDGSTGDFIRVVFRPFAFGLVDPISLKFGPNGNLFLSDDSSFRPTLFEFDPVTGELVRIVVREQGASKADFVYEPVRDTWLMCVKFQSRIERFDYETGDSLEIIVAENDEEVLKLRRPWDMGFGPSGNLFVVGVATLISDGPRELGAIHEYDGTTYEPVQVFGYAQEWPPTENELWKPLSMEFKPRPGDYGGDQAGGDWDVDLEDFGHLNDHLAGPGEPVRDALALIAFDTDHDRDIDLRDFAAFQIAYTGEK